MMAGHDPYGFQRRFQLQIEPNADLAILRLAGEFDLSAKTEFERRFAEVASGSPAEVVVDLRDLVFIDSTGLSLISEAWKNARRSGFDFAVLLNDAVRDVFQQAGLGHLPVIEASSMPPPI
jgi:anti-anti-sigma factor